MSVTLTKNLDVYSLHSGNRKHKKMPSKISKWCLVHIFFADHGGKISHNIIFSVSSSCAYQRYLICKHTKDGLLRLCLCNELFVHISQNAANLIFQHDILKSRISLHLTKITNMKTEDDYL